MPFNNDINIEQIQELVLKDDFGIIKETLYNEVKEQLPIGGIDKSVLPRLFQREIDKTDSKLCNKSIKDVLSFSEKDIEDVFGKNTKPIQKSFVEFFENVDRYPQVFYQCYIALQKIEINLGLSGGDDVIELIDRLLLFCEALFNYELIADKNHKESDKLKRVRFYFEGKSLSEIATYFNESTENTRNLIKNRNLLVEVLNNVSNLQLDSSTLKIIENFKERFLFSCAFFEELKQSEFNHDIQNIIICNKLEFLGINAFEFEIDETKTYLTDLEILPFRSYINSFNQFVKKTEEFYTLPELFQQFSTYYEAQKTKDKKFKNTRFVFDRVVEKFPVINKIWNDELEENIYSTQWNYLGSTSLKISRILLEHKERMSSDEIFEEYNERCKANNEPEIQDKSNLFIRSSETIHSVQHGYWIYSKEKIEKQDVREVINDFILKNNGIVTFEKVVSHVKELEFTYPDSSIRAYITSVARPSLDNSDLFVHEEYIDKVDIRVGERRNSLIGKDLLPIIQNVLLNLENDISYKNLLKKISSKVKENKIPLKNKNLIYSYLDKFNKSNLFTVHGGDILLVNSIDKERLQKLEYRPEPEYKKHIRNEAIALLKETESHTLRIKEIRNQLIHLLPKNVSGTNFYRIFSQSELFKTIDVNGTLFYQLNTEHLPKAKPFTEEVFEPEESVVVNEDIQTVEAIEKALVLEQDESTNPFVEQSVFNNFNFRMNNQQVFDFVAEELGRKYKNAKWFKEGFEGFKSILGAQPNSDQYWGTKILRSLGRVLINMSDFYDRDSCLQRLSLSFETYLKQFDEFTFNSEKGNNATLGYIIKSSNKLNSLLEYSKNNKYTKEDSLYAFSTSLSKIWTYRNAYAHDQESDKLEITISEHVKYIMDFIGLYIFIPYLVKNG